MKLAEALLERKSLKQKIESLQGRLAENAMVQEGDTPSEDPQTATRRRLGIRRHRANRLQDREIHSGIHPAG